MRKLLTLLLLGSAIGISHAGQSAEMDITLSDAISMARCNSVDAAAALDELRQAYWEWRAFRADQLPEVSLEATLPAYANQYSYYLNDAGSYSFVHTNTLQMSASLSVKQNIRLTGATLALKTSVDWLRQFGDNASNRFLSIPIALTLNQPLFAVNTMKWDSRIEPIRFTEAKASFLSATEDVAVTAVGYFFTLVLSRENLAIASQNLQNAERLYEVAVEKRRMGSISQNDLLQMELNVLDARSTLTDARSTLRADMFRLRAFLALPDSVELVPVVPTTVPNAEITYTDALNFAMANNSFFQTIRRSQLEADYEVAKAKGNLRQVSVFAQVGYTGADNNIADAYSRLRGNQVVEVGVSLPLLDWGKRRGQVRAAESSRRATESRIQRESMDFRHDLFILVERFCNQREQLHIAARADEIARQRYNSYVESYLVGNVSVLDLNDSQQRKDEARRQYYTELYSFWNYWYQLRSLTLYDFEHRGDINADFDRLFKQ